MNRANLHINKCGGTYSRRESMLKLREQLIEAEEDRLMGKKGFTLAEVEERMRKAISEVTGERCG